MVVALQVGSPGGYGSLRLEKAVRKATKKMHMEIEQLTLPSSLRSVSRGLRRVKREFNLVELVTANF